MNITTQRTDYCWLATDDDTYEPGCPIGIGATEDAARRDLLERIEDRAVEPLTRQWWNGFMRDLTR